MIKGSALNPSWPARLLLHHPKGSLGLGMALHHGKEDAYKQDSSVDPAHADLVNSYTNFSWNALSICGGYVGFEYGET